MRLLNIYTLKFQEFFESEIPPYFILSLRWGRDEISYEEFCRDPPPDKAGYHKVVSFCEFIRQRRHNLRETPKLWIPRTQQADDPLPGGEWVRVDTCCIDKRSSAELSEAINSMFNWYKRAYECIVLLSDVPCWQEIRTSPPYQKADYNASNEALAARKCLQAQWPELDMDPLWRQVARQHLGEPIIFALCRSAWFTRGWTLQELIAPTKVTFCNACWEVLGHVCGAYAACENSMYTYGLHLNDMVSNITRIPVGCLSNELQLRSASVAQRMSWASKRTTTRTEDEAYCLLGIFDVNMPLLYGEGNKAFRRLQLEIIQRSTDHSLFAWNIKGPGDELVDPFGYMSILAPTVACFAKSFAVERSAVETQNEEYAVTNRGLRLEIETFLPPWFTIDQGDRCMRLNCVDAERGRSRVVIHLRRLRNGIYRCKHRSLRKPIREEDLGQSCGKEKLYIYTGFENT